MERADLEKFIENNRDDFDMFEPSPELWDKIDKETAGYKQTEIQPLRIYYKRILSYAAVIVATIISTVFILKYSDNQVAVEIAEEKGIREKDQADSIPEVIKDFNETQNYYTYQVSYKMDELEKYAEKYPDLIEDLKNEITELDAEFESLTGDLNEKMNNEEIIQAMIQNYRIKLKILENVMIVINGTEGVEMAKEEKKAL